MDLLLRRGLARRLLLTREDFQDKSRCRLAGRDLPGQSLVGDVAAGRIGKRSGLVLCLLILYFFLW